MRKYNYEAKDSKTNKIVKASVQADSERSAAKLLIDQGFTPLIIKEDESDKSKLFSFLNRITTKDKIVFTRQFATLIAAGLPLATSLHTILEQTENKRFRDIIQDVIASVEGGRTLADSFGKHPEVFDKVFLALIAAGEASGTLDQSLTRLANQQEKDEETMSRIRGALTYPVIVLVVILGVMAFMLLTVVPQVAQLYKSLGKELPLLTKLMIALADLAIHWWWLMITALGAAVFFIAQWLKTESGIYTAALVKLNVPLFKNMFRKLYMQRFARTGQSLLSSGVAMLDMLSITGEALNNVIVQKSVEKAADKVKGGKALSEALAPEAYILPLLPQMIKIGEQSGKIDEMLGKVSIIYERELDEQIKAISTAIEPVLMVVLAVVAGSMVAAILFPIYNLVNTITTVH